MDCNNSYIGFTDKWTVIEINFPNFIIFMLGGEYGDGGGWVGGDGGSWGEGVLPDGPDAGGCGGGGCDGAIGGGGNVISGGKYIISSMK